MGAGLRKGLLPGRALTKVSTERKKRPLMMAVAELVECGQPSVIRYLNGE
jgi:hypothetical protein